jgi:hypothetical protein
MSSAAPDNDAASPILRTMRPGHFARRAQSDANKLEDDTIAGLAEIASRGLIVACGDKVTVVDTRRSVVQARH